MSTLFLTNEVLLGRDSAILNSVLNVRDHRSGTLVLEAGDTHTFVGDSWCALMLQVVGSVTIETESTDWDNSTVITGEVLTYGIAKYPGTYSLVTKAATFTLTAGSDGATVDYLFAHLLTDAQL